MERSIKKSLVWFYSISLISEREICICVCACVYIFKRLLPFSIVIYSHVKSVSRLRVYNIQSERCFWGNLHKYHRDWNNLSIYTGDTVKADTPPLVVPLHTVTISREVRVKKRKTSVMFLANYLIGHWFRCVCMWVSLESGKDENKYRYCGFKISHLTKFTYYHLYRKQCIIT
jgi:hypothetical protein